MLDTILCAVSKDNIVWRQHALSRMLERNISRSDVVLAIQSGIIIESYPEAKPYPGCLIAGSSEKKNIHAVVAYDTASEAVYIITVYVPDLKHFQQNGIPTKKR